MVMHCCCYSEMYKSHDLQSIDLSNTPITHFIVIKHYKNCMKCCMFHMLHKLYEITLHVKTELSHSSKHKDIQKVSFIGISWFVGVVVWLM